MGDDVCYEIPDITPDLPEEPISDFSENVDDILSSDTLDMEPTEILDFSEDCPEVLNDQNDCNSENIITDIPEDVFTDEGVGFETEFTDNSHFDIPEDIELPPDERQSDVQQEMIPEDCDSFDMFPEECSEASDNIPVCAGR